MSTSINSVLSPLHEIIKPYHEGDEELPFYNSQLEANIAKIRALIPQLEAKESELASQWISRLQHQMETNNHFVARQKSENAHFSLSFCALTGNLAGFKYLLRTGEDPNVLENGKAAVHIAAAKGLANFVAILKQCPVFDLELKTRSGKTAREIAVTDEMKRIL